MWPSTLLLAVGIALVIPALTLNFHWFSSYPDARWAGWASMGCASGAAFCLVVGARLLEAGA